MPHEFMNGINPILHCPYQLCSLSMPSLHSAHSQKLARYLPRQSRCWHQAGINHSALVLLLLGGRGWGNYVFDFLNKVCGARRGGQTSSIPLKVAWRIRSSGSEVASKRRFGKGAGQIVDCRDCERELRWPTYSTMSVPPDSTYSVLVL